MHAGKVVSDSFAKQDLHLDKPIVRVGLLIDGNWLEGVALLNGSNFEQATLRATSRALGFPDVQWELSDRQLVLEGLEIQGLKFDFCAPDGTILGAEHRFQDGPRSPGVALAMAFAEAAKSYFDSRGTKSRNRTH